MVEHAHIIQGAFEKKEEIHKSTQRIRDIAVDNEFTYKKEDIEQIKQEILTILSCVVELEPYAPFFKKKRFSNIEKDGLRIFAFLSSKMIKPARLNKFCVAVDSIEIKPTKTSMKVVFKVDL